MHNAEPNIAQSSAMTLATTIFGRYDRRITVLTFHYAHKHSNVHVLYMWMCMMNKKNIWISKLEYTLGTVKMRTISFADRDDIFCSFSSYVLADFVLFTNFSIVILCVQYLL